MSTSPDDEDLEDPFSEDALRVYRAAVERVGPDAVHEAIIRGGPAILERGIPYVVIAARWRIQDEARRGRRAVSIDEAAPSDLVTKLPSPFDDVLENEGRRTLVEALARLPDEDVLAVWRHLEGFSDAAIADEWIRLGLRDGAVSAELVRQHRSRALARMRRELGRDKSL